MAQADITDELIRIKGEERGEDVRGSIISAFNKLNSTPGSANSVDGYTVKDLILKEDIADILPLEDELKEFGSRAVKSGAIYNYLEKVDNVLDGIAGDSSSIPYSSASIRQKISYVNDTRKRIRAAIIAKQVEVDKDATFRSYADKVKAIPTVAEIQTSEVTISENGEFDAGKGKAYSIVTAEAKPKTATKSINKVGHFKASDDDVEAYSSVEVDISSGLTTKSITAEDLSKDSYSTVIKASDTKDKDTIGFSEVSIDVSGKFQELKEEIDPSGGKEDFVFDAKDEELYGYSKVTVTVMNITGPFTVEFYDGDTKLYTDENVPKNGTCDYKGNPKLEKKGYVFQGWEPKPVNVTKNLKCYATWKKQKGPTDFTQKTWNDIAENGGIDAIPGETEKKIYWKAFTYRGIEFATSSSTARCVATGEDGTSSTWVMSVRLRDLMIGERKGLSYFSNPDDYTPDSTSGLYDGEGNNIIRTYQDSKVSDFFSNTFANAIRQYPKQENLYFRNVNKWTLICDKNGAAVEDLISCSGLWLLSAREAGSTTAEKNGPIYPGFDGSSINSMTRSAGSMAIERTLHGAAEGTGCQTTNEIVAAWVDSIGESNYTCPFHLWWNETYHQYLKDKGLIGPFGLWRSIEDEWYKTGYVEQVYIGFCL